MDKKKMAALMMAGKKHKKGQVKEDGMKHAAVNYQRLKPRASDTY